MTPIEVIKPGANVRIAVDTESPIVGQLLEVCIKSSGVQYRVSWWDGRTRHAEWLETIEVAAIEDSGSKMKVGFA